MSEFPPGVTVEPVWLVEAFYAPDAAETRTPFRARHLARLAELRDEGIVIESGGMADMSRAVLLVRAESEEAALDIARADIYMANGVWVEVRAGAFGRVVRTDAAPVS
jgi:uncharacterized protein YciI